ncbi:MAG: hypothetical protein AB7N70_35895 [Dehalococcoidia bacterium]
MNDFLPIVRLSCTAAEILGTFLLAIEAMKLENFRVLRDRFVQPFYHALNPTIEIVDEPVSPRTWKRPLETLEVFFVGILAIGALVVMLGFAAFDASPARIVQYLAGHVPGPNLLGLVAAWSILAIGVTLGSALLGGIAYSLVAALALAAVRCLDTIDRHTPTGVIGLLGFVSFLLGAAIKAYLDWVTRRAV